MGSVARNGLDIGELLALDSVGPGRWRTRHGDANLNGRSYGGQLLGHALAAALKDVPAGRDATMMQFLFLQGAMPQEPLELHVTTLQCVFRPNVTAHFGIVTGHFGHRDRRFGSF